MVVWKLCLVGFGGIGKDFADLLLNDTSYVDSLRSQYGCEFVVIAVCTHSRGNLVSPSGVDLKQALAELHSDAKFSSDNPDLSSLTTLQIIESTDADIVVEISSLSVEDGQPAVSHIETALASGKHVVSANKGPVVWAYEHLRAASRKAHRNYFFEGCVMDGTPVFNLVDKTLPGCKVNSIRGVLNSTTNFVLAELEKGGSIEHAVKEAQRLGFAEAEPSNDLDGWDAAFKTALLMIVLMDTPCNPSDVARHTMNDVSPEEVEAARRQGTPYKFVCSAERGGAARVHLEKLPSTDPLSHIAGTSSALTLNTDMMGPITIIETDPLIRQTTYAIVSDILRVVVENPRAK